MPAPQGEALSLMVDGQEMQVQIEPRILSRKAQEALSRFVRKKTRDGIWQDLVDLRTADMPDDVREELKTGYMQLLQQSPGVEESMRAMTTPDGIVAMLEVVSNLTHEDAKRAVADSENFVKIAAALGDVANREADAAKNS